MLTKSFLPSVGLWHSSNTFAECVWSFDECPCDSAKKSCPVLMVSLIRCNVCKVLLGTSCKYTFFSSHGYLIELSDQRLHHLPIQRPTLFFYYGGVLFLNQPTTDKGQVPWICMHIQGDCIWCLVWVGFRTNQRFDRTYFNFVETN